MPETIAVPLAASRARICSTSAKILFNDVTHEPFLAVPSSSSPPTSSYILTPPRLSDVVDRVRLLNAPTVSPFLFSPPKPYLAAHATARTQDALESADGIVQRWVETGTPDGCPFEAIREVKEGVETFVGELGFFRESSFMEVPEGEERDKAIEVNLAKEPGDPSIVWTMFFLLLPEYAGKGIMSLVLSTLFKTFLVPSHLLNVHHILSYAFVGNDGSRRIHEKLGFHLIGTDWLDMREDRGGGKREEWIFEWKR